MRSGAGECLAALVVGLVVAVLVPVEQAWVLLVTAPWLPCIALSHRGALIGWVAAGVLIALFGQADALERRPMLDSPEPVTVIGEVVSLPDRSPGRQRFILRPERIADRTHGLPRRIRVSLYGDRSTVGAGERWRLSLRLRRPRGYMNPVRFDYERWLASEHIDATASVVRPETMQRLTRGEGLTHWRARFSAHIARLGRTEGPGTALLQGLITGDRRGFSDRTWSILRATGTSHLMAISGLHIGLAAALGYGLGRWLWRILHVPGRRTATASVVASATALAYAAMAGFALPTTRALLMGVILALATWLGHRIAPPRVLLIAAALILIADPAAVLGAGFWLSFVAVGLILVAMRGQRFGPLTGLWRLQVALLIGLAPLSALFFGSWSPAGLVINLLILPLFSVMIVPVALGAALASLVVPSLAGPILHALARLLDGLMAGGDQLLEQGVAAWPLNPPGPLAVAALLVGLGLLILPRGMPLRALAPLLIALFFLTRPPLSERGAVTITWLEVGQGNATVIQTRSATLVIDTGPAWSGGANAAAFSLVPFLEAEGIERIDRLIVTHADRDHRGGVNALSGAVAIERVESGEPLADLPQATRCQTGARWQVAGVRFEYLWPDDPASLEGNAASCVLRLRAPSGDVLFTGDIDHAIERAIAGRIDRPVIALEAPHHGSRTGTGPRLLEAAAPQAAVISAGYRNPYGMPHPAVIERLRCRGIQYFDTGRQGAVQLRLTPGQPPRWRTARGGDRLLLHESPQRRRFQNAARIPYDRSLNSGASMESRQPTCGN